jgi:NAD(P)-dependent dehydrogenase (short-subunit alcohol dehydrogenase family)
MRGFKPEVLESEMPKVAVVTGAGAGVGRATAEEFARRGYDVALLSRDSGRLEAAAEEARRFGVRALAIPTDVADAEAVERAAARAEAELGPIDVWVNVAMATIFGPVSRLTPREFERATQVTYLGQVYGVMAALKWMRPRNRGAIVNVGSALAHRAIPLQSVYCGAKFAVRGFTDSLRSEILHDKLDIKIAEVDLPAINTPQFDWALNKTGLRATPVPPIYQPEVAARAIVFAATHERPRMWVGFSTVKAIVANWIAPGRLDRYLASAGYSGQLADRLLPSGAPSNLFEPVPGAYGAHGRFDHQAKAISLEAFADRHRAAVTLGAIALAVMCLRRRRRKRAYR